jgi:ABC-type oligopeptide transport system substrate-binding subunit
MRRPPLNDVKFRKALLYLTDRDRIVSEGLKGLGNVLPAGLVGPAYGDWQNKKIAEYSFDPAKAAQILHIGPYSSEAANIQKIHAAIKASGHQLGGKHHEIYLSDPNKQPPKN